MILLPIIDITDTQVIPLTLIILQPVLSISPFCFWRLDMEYPKKPKRKSQYEAMKELSSQWICDQYEMSNIDGEEYHLFLAN